MKIAMLITGVMGSVLAVIGGIIKANARENDDADKLVVGNKIAAVGSLALAVCCILFTILSVRILFSLM